MNQLRAESAAGDTGTNSTRLYTPLATSTNIRLFILSPGDPSNKIHGKLNIVDLEDKPEFEALSYEWGLLSYKYNR
jgi:hypothetical protein